MNYPELCEKLKHEFGRAAVFDKRYPKLGPPEVEMASLVIWVRDGFHAVGGIDRGEFKTVHEFSPESDACDYVLNALRRNASIPAESADERRASRAETDAFTSQLLREFDGRDAG